MAIHATAVVQPGAEIDATAEVGPYCVIGPQVKIGARSRLVAHVVVDNETTIGHDNVIYPFASLGSAPQDLKYKGEPARLRIGNHNVIRESVTLNIGTQGGRLETQVGDHCLLMAYSHVAHDCIVGNRVVLANSVALAGHVDLGDHVIMGGIAGIHQFCRVGKHAFIAGGAMAAQDVPPFCIAQGDRAQLVGINVVGLRRAGWDRQRLQQMRLAYKKLFQSTSTRMVALERVEQDLASSNDDVAELCAFIRDSARGVCFPRSALPINDMDDET